MPQYYFDVVTYSPGDKPDPETDRIISIQYRKIDFRSGRPLQEMETLREWESSEEDIVTRFFNTFFRGGQNKWIFIPVGYGLNAIWEIITLKFEQYLGPYFTNPWFYLTIPSLDLEPVVVMLNSGNFIGARLEKFTGEPEYKHRVKAWYEARDFEAIDSAIVSSASAFLTFYQRLKQRIPSILEDVHGASDHGPSSGTGEGKGGPDERSGPKPPPLPETSSAHVTGTVSGPPKGTTMAPGRPSPTPATPTAPPIPMPKTSPTPATPAAPPIPMPKSVPSASSVPPPVPGSVSGTGIPDTQVQYDDPEGEMEVEEYSVEVEGTAHYEVGEELSSSGEDGIEAEVTVEAEEFEGIEVEGEIPEAVDSEDGEAVEALSSRDLKKRMKDESKRRKIEEKLLKKQQKMG